MYLRGYRFFAAADPPTILSVTARLTVLRSVRLVGLLIVIPLLDDVCQAFLLSVKKTNDYLYTLVTSCKTRVSHGEAWCVQRENVKSVRDRYCQKHEVCCIDVSLSYDMYYLVIMQILITLPFQSHVLCCSSRVVASVSETGNLDFSLLR